MCPNWLLRRQGVSCGAKICYARLAQFSGQRGFSFPSHSTLARELGVSRDSVVRYLNELKEHGLIETRKSTRRHTLLYFFIFKGEWIGKNDYLKQNKKKNEDNTY